MPRTRSQEVRALNENIDVNAVNLKRAAHSPGNPPKAQKRAFGDITNAISSFAIDSSKKVDVTASKSNADNKLTAKGKLNKVQSVANLALKGVTLNRSKPVQNQKDENRNTNLPLPQDQQVIISQHGPNKSKSFDMLLGTQTSNGSSLPSAEKAESWTTTEESVEPEKAGNDDKYRLSLDASFDYDASLIHDPFNVPNYASDIFEYYKQRETVFKVENYMPRHKSINKAMRTILVDWMVEIQENFELNHETLYQAVKMCDLFLSKTDDPILKEDLQLVGATALFICSKFDERQPPCLGDFLYICDDAYTRDQLLANEMNMLITLDFDIGFPLSYRFVRRYAKTAKLSMEALTLARYILESSLLHFEFSLERESYVASGALLLALKMSNISWTSTLSKYSGYAESDLESIMWRLNRMLKAPQSKSIRSVLMKYSHEVFHCVAQVPPLPDQQQRC